MLLEKIIKQTGRALGIAGLSLALTACPANGNGGNGVPGVVSCDSANIPTNSSTLLLESYSLPLDFSSFDDNCQVYKKDGEFFVVPRTQSEKEKVELEGLVQVFPNNTTEENLLNIVGSSGRRLFEWLTEEQNYITRTGQNITFNVHDHFSIEQLQTISDRFSVEGQYNQDFVLATIDYFNSSLEHDTGNVTAWSVRGTSWPLEWSAGFPLSNHDSQKTGLEVLGIMESYTPLNWGAIGTPLTYPAIEYGTGSSYNDARYDVCSFNYEPKSFSSPVIVVNTEYVYNELDGNMPVINPFYGDVEIRTVRVSPVPSYEPEQDMTIVFEYKPSKSLINADSVRMVIGHTSGLNGSMDESLIPQEGDIKKPQEEIAYLNPLYEQITNSGFLLDYYISVSEDSPIPGIPYGTSRGSFWEGYKKADDMLENHDNNTAVTIGKNHWIYNNMVSVGPTLVMNRSALQPCANSAYSLPEMPE